MAGTNTIQKPYRMGFSHLTKRLLPAVILSVALLGCGRVSPPTAPETQEVRSAKTRVTVPLATDSELSDLYAETTPSPLTSIKFARGRKWEPVLFSLQHLAGTCHDVCRCQRAKPNARYQTHYTSSYPRTSCTPRSTPLTSNSPLAAKAAVAQRARDFN